MNDTTLLILLYLFTDPEPKKYTPPLMPATCMYINFSVMVEIDMVCQRGKAEDFFFCHNYLSDLDYDACDDYYDLEFNIEEKEQLLRAWDTHLIYMEYIDREKTQKEEKEDLGNEEGYLK